MDKPKEVIFRNLNIGDVILCNGEAVTKIKPIYGRGKCFNARDSHNDLIYIEDNEVNIFESIED